MINMTVCEYKDMKKIFRKCIYLYIIIYQRLTLWVFFILFCFGFLVFLVLFCFYVCLFFLRGCFLFFFFYDFGVFFCFSLWGGYFFFFVLSYFLFF